MGSPTVASVTVYLKKDKMRMEMDEEGVSTILLNDLTTNTDYTYMPAQNTAYITSNSTPSTFFVASAAGGVLEHYNPQVTGTETIDGIVCQIYEFSDSGTTVEMWLWKDKGLPIKTVITGTDGNGEFDYKNYDFSDIADSMFVLPDGVTIVPAPGS